MSVALHTGERALFLTEQDGIPAKYRDRIRESNRTGGELHPDDTTRGGGDSIRAN